MKKNKNVKKENKITSVIQFVLFATIFIIVPGFVGRLENIYTMKATVTQIQGEEIIVEDSTGNVWAFSGNGYLEGDKLQLTFDTNYTDNNRLDDEIIKAKIIK